MGNLDLMIGAQALAWELILVTNDQAFRRIKKLKVEDWTKP
jgi:predicted nucleic acid-binding protein